MPPFPKARLMLQPIRRLRMGLSNATQDRKATDVLNYTRPAKPLAYVWVGGVTPFVSWIEIHVYNNSSFFQFLISIPVFAFFIYLFLVAFLIASKLEIDKECVRRSLLGRSIICLPWRNVKVIQAFYIHRQGVGLVGGYRIISKTKFLMFGLIYFVDEAEVLAPKLNLIAKRFDIPLEQRPDLYGDFESVDAIRFK